MVENVVPKATGFRRVIYYRVSRGCPGYYAAEFPVDLACLGVPDVVYPVDLGDPGLVAPDDAAPLSEGVRDSLAAPPGDSEGGDRALWDALGCVLPVVPVNATMEVHRARDWDPAAGCLVELPLVVAVTLIPVCSVRFLGSKEAGTVRHRLQQILMLCTTARQSCEKIRIYSYLVTTRIKYFCLHSRCKSTLRFRLHQVSAMMLAILVH